MIKPMKQKPLESTDMSSTCTMFWTGKVNVNNMHLSKLNLQSHGKLFVKLFQDTAPNATLFTKSGLNKALLRDDAG